MTERLSSSLAKVKVQYARWEGRNVARFTTWSVARRWVSFVFVPTVLICCGGTVVGVPAGWVFRETVEASKGAPSPDAAADEYLMALSYDNDEGLVAVLDNRHQDELLDQWHAYRDAMKSTDPPPFRLDFGALFVSDAAEDRATVTTDVAATWWDTDSVGRLGGYRSEAYAWRFTTREDNGWQVVSVDAPVWCGGYVRLDACA